MENQDGNLQPKDETETVENSALISKHCPNVDCDLYGLPQPNRTICFECGNPLVE